MNVEKHINKIINQFNLDKINNNISYNLSILEAYWLNLNLINPNYSAKSIMIPINGDRSAIIPKDSLINGSNVHFTKENFYYNNIQLSSLSVNNGYINMKFSNISCQYPIRIYTNRHILHAIFNNQSAVNSDDYLIKLNKHSLSDLIEGNLLGGSFTITNKKPYNNQEYINIPIPIKSTINCTINDFIINHIDINNEAIESIDIDIDLPGEYLINNILISKTISLEYNSQTIPFINSDVNGWYYLKKQDKLYISVNDSIIKQFGKGLYNLRCYSLRDIESSNLSFQDITQCNIVNTQKYPSISYQKQHIDYQVPNLYEDNLENLIKKLQDIYPDCFFNLKINPVVVPSTINNIRLPVIKYNCTIFSNLNHPALFYAVANHYEDKYLIDYHISH